MRKQLPRDADALIKWARENGDECEDHLGGPLPFDVDADTWRAIARAIAGYQVALDMHKALGVEWGHDPYAVIARLRADGERVDWLSQFVFLSGDARVMASDGLPAAMDWEWDPFDGGPLRDAIDSTREANP